MKKPYWGFLAVQLALPAVMGVGWLTGRTLVLHTWAYVLVLEAASLPLTAAIRKAPGTTGGGRCLLAALVQGLCLLTNDGGPWAMAGAVLSAVCGWLILAAGPSRRRKTAAGVLGGLLSLVLAGLLALRLFTGVMTRETTLGQWDSPAGTRTVTVTALDQGALGGNTDAWVRDNDTAWPLGLGTLARCRRVYRGGWGDGQALTVQWLDENTLELNGKQMSVDIESVAWLERVERKLDISLPCGLVEQAWDSHGGFHGDGETLAVIATELTEPQGQYWHPLPLTDNLKTLLSRSGLEGMDVMAQTVPGIEQGFCYFRDRHSESQDPASDDGILDRYSYNLTLAVYDSGTGTLYVWLLDT